MKMLGSGDSAHIVKLRGLPFSTTVEDVLDFLNGVDVLNGKEGDFPDAHLLRNFVLNSFIEIVKTTTINTNTSRFLLAI